MATYSALRRYYLIIEKIKQRGSTSFKDIESHLNNNDVNISKRTLQRDISQIKTDFGVEIVYNRERDRYDIDEEASANLNGFYQFLELSLSAEILREGLQVQRELLQYVHFEESDLLAGQNNLKIMLEAISLNRWITFKYEKFVEEGVKEHNAIPCLVKRYQNRWYVFSKLETGYSATFGLDRITNLKMLTKKFTDKDVSIPEGFEAVVGLNYSGEQTTVVLQAEAIQAKYLKSVPLHRSQKVRQETQHHTIFEYDLIPNFELKQAILRLGEQVKVLEPEGLRSDVAETLKRALLLYS